MRIEDPEGEQLMRRRPDQPRLYLWLCAEGWVRFGPFEWLRFDDQTSTIQDSRGAIIAKRTDNDWVVDDPKYAGWQFRNPTMTTTARHPHANCGDPCFRHRYNETGTDRAMS